MRTRVASVHPSQEFPTENSQVNSMEYWTVDLPVVNDEVRDRELVRVEDERRDTERKDREPEVDDPASPERERHEQEHDEDTHAEVDRRTRETRVQDAERNPRDGESTTGCDVSSATERQVARDRVRQDRSVEDLECRGHRTEVLRETLDSLDRSTVNQFCMNTLVTLNHPRI